MCRGRHVPRPGSGRTSEWRAMRHTGSRPPDRVTVAARSGCGTVADRSWACLALFAASSTLRYTAKTLIKASGFQNPAHRLLRGCQAQATAALPGPFPHPQQHRQSAVADALQTRQVHGDRWPAGRHGRDQVRRDTGDVGQVKRPTQGDDGLTVEVTDAEIHVNHGFTHDPAAGAGARAQRTTRSGQMSRVIGLPADRRRNKSRERPIRSPRSARGAGSGGVCSACRRSPVTGQW